MTRIPLTDSCRGADGASKLGASVGAIRGGGTLCAVRVGNDAATSQPRKEPNSTQACHRGQPPPWLWNRIGEPNRHFRIQFIALHTRRSTDRSSSPLLESIVPMIGLLPKQPPPVTVNSVAVDDAEHAVRPNDEAGRHGFLRPRVTTKQCYHHPSLSVVCNWFRHISSTSRHIWIRLCPRNFCKITPQVGKTLSLSIHFTKWGVCRWAWGGERRAKQWRLPDSKASFCLRRRRVPPGPPSRASLRPLVESTPGTVKCSVNRDKA